jgi:phenylacetate-coenzyme A ligase PaaK-like adenylate-forming protein
MNNNTTFAEPYSLNKPQKQLALLDALKTLTLLHTQKCAAYNQILAALNFYASRIENATSTEALPFLPVRLFKTLALSSVPQTEIVKTLMSSGTSGQVVSKIFLDAETANAQTRALAKIVSSFVGKTRAPMVIVDNKSILTDRAKFNARAAGILGFSGFGRNHFYLLNDAMEPDWDGLEKFLHQYQNGPILVFGFTFIVWQYLLEAKKQLSSRTIDFGSQSILIHGGGWKKLHDKKVSNPAFKARLLHELGISQVIDYYGMVEQVGSVFMECAEGFLHTPDFADVIVRDRHNFAVSPVGETGLIQVLSTLPKSYPGHSLLTEDLGILHGEDNCKCGRLGKYFSVLGRLPNVEIRGCSDTRTIPETTPLPSLQPHSNEM